MDKFKETNNIYAISILFLILSVNETVTQIKFLHLFTISWDWILYFIEIMFGLFDKQKNADGKYQRPFYSFRSVHADKVLDISQGGPHQGKAIIWEGWGGDNQMFTIVKEAGYWLIRAKNGQFLTVTGPQDNAPIVLAPKTGQENQRFNIQEHPGSKDHIIYTYCGKVLDVLGELKENGSIVGQYNFTGGKNQLWNFCDPKNITSSSSDND